MGCDPGLFGASPPNKNIIAGDFGQNLHHLMQTLLALFVFGKEILKLYTGLV